MAFQFQSKSITITLNKKRQEFISVFKYGSVVFFNVQEEGHSEHIRNIRRLAMKNSISDELQHTEQYDLYVDRYLLSFQLCNKCTHLYTRTHVLYVSMHMCIHLYKHIAKDKHYEKKRRVICANIG